MNELGSLAVTLALSVCIVVIIAILVVIWSIKRHRDPDLAIECQSSIEQLIPSLAGLTLSTAIAGNSVEVFENGALFRRPAGRNPRG